MRRQRRACISSFKRNRWITKKIQIVPTVIPTTAELALFARRQKLTVSERSILILVLLNYIKASMKVKWFKLITACLRKEMVLNVVVNASKLIIPNAYKITFASKMQTMHTSSKIKM